ncbi:outer membrane beta-barrel protein [Fodinibius salsisoli]|uniref:Outer membrane beta-barrel protein n=1 Tax=Fodinibius salsisoli TaxID=2820877 RepID=A0ABT3PK74_9BACT|nr:outer membrane beta-barrel protein [Fodinibius salsisoli]MCW9706336.1 outer membrane beta-barrel protein [Fodinibius salsisoli]
MDSRNNKDPIERLFQKKAEEYDISYQEKDWLKLEKRLDEQDQMIANRRKRWFIAAAVLLLFSFLGYAIYQNSQKIERLHQQLQEQEFTQNSPNDQSNTPSTQPDGGQSTENNRSSSPSTPAGELDPDSDIASTESNRHSREENRGQSFQSADFIVSADAVQKTAYDLPCGDCQLGDMAELQPSSPSTALNQGQVTGTSPSPYLTAVEKGNQEESTARTQTALSDPSWANRSKLSVGFLAGPDLSTAGSLSDFHSPGYSLGLNIAYRLSPNFSIQAGFIRSVSRYVAGSNDYHPPQSFLGYGDSPLKTIAECAIIDIPLSIKYDWAHFDQSRIFATAGVSSYIMLSEDYKFEYASAGNDQAKGWYGKTGTRHWSSNINLSIGYEYDLNNRFSLRVEPFLKLPIREVGWGNVKLYSLGSFISFNYNLY